MCYADNDARNVCDRKSCRGYAPLREYNGSSIAGARERRRTCAAYGTAADRRLRPQGETADQRLRAPKRGGAHSAQPNAYPLYNYTTPILVLYMFMLSNFHTELGFSVRCAR